MTVPEWQRLLLRKIGEMPFDQRKQLEREWSKLKPVPDMLPALRGLNAARKGVQ